MYPQTPPNSVSLLKAIYILQSDDCSGLNPTSSRIEYFGFSYRQKPLKNQL
jgi:hypothetical protein